MPEKVPSPFWSLARKITRPNLRVKSILLTAGLVLLTIIITSAFFLVETEKALIREKELRASALLENLTELNREALILNDSVALETAVRRVIGNEDIVYALISTKNGEDFFATSLKSGDRIIARLKELSRASPRPRKQTLKLGAESIFDFRLTLSVQEKPQGTIHLGLSARGINQVLQKTRNKVLWISGLLLLVLLSLTLTLVTLAVRPLERITEHARSLGQGEREKKLNLHRHDEIGELAFTLDQMSDEIRAAETRLVEQERMKRELEIARQMQTQLLPSRLPEIPRLELAHLFHPALEVSGDFYDCISLSDGSYGIIIADVAGKGLKGAWIASITRTILRTLLEQEAANIWSPKNLLVRLDALLKSDLEWGMFVTMLYLAVDPVQEEFVLASAGHPEILHFGPEGVKEIPSSGPALGAVPNQQLEAALEEKNLVLGPGEGFFLYTDGLVEARNSQQEEFGLERLKAGLARNAGLAADEILPRLVTEMRTFCGSKEFEDDVTMVAIKRI